MCGRLQRNCQRINLQVWFVDRLVNISNSQISNYKFPMSNQIQIIKFQNFRFLSFDIDWKFEIFHLDL